MTSGRSSRHRFPCCIAVAAATLVTAASVTLADDKRPNIVLILADDLGYSDIEPYGAVKIQTPNLQRLADEGMRFTQMYNTSKCFPSRACLLTGVYAQQNDMWKSNGTINHAVNLGEALKPAGYRTIAVGKHHGKENLYDRGFDHYYGLRDGGCNYFNPGEQRPGDLGKPAQKSWAYPPGRAFCFDEQTIKGWTPEDEDFYMTDNTTDWAIKLLSKYENQQKPFFLYVSYTAPHDPLHARPEDIRKYEGKFDDGFDAIRQARYQRQLELGLLDKATYPLSTPTHRDWNKLSKKERRDQSRRMEVYAAMVDSMDQNIGRLTNHLKERGELENTIIMFASDNGSSAEVVRIGEGPIGSMTRWASLKKDWANVGNTPFRYYKNSSYGGGTCTPFIVRWPGQIKAGSKTDFMSHFVDLMPTLLDIAGGEYPDKHKGGKIAPLAGKSLLPVLKGNTDAKREGPLFWQWGNGKAVYQDGWKLIKQGKGGWKFYQLRENRTETNDLAKKHPEGANELEKLWNHWWESTEPYRND